MLRFICICKGISRRKPLVLLPLHKLVFMIMEICDFFFYSDLDLHDHNDYDDNDYVGHNDL